MVKSVVYLNINKVVEMSNKQYENLIWVSWNSFRNNNFLNAYIFSAENESLMSAFLTSAMWDFKGEVYEYNGEKFITEEVIKEYLTPYQPFILRKTTLTNLKDKKLPDSIEKIDKGENIKAEQLFNLVKEHTNWYKDKSGIAASMELKKERKTMSEGEIDTHNTSNIQKITLVELENFADEVNEKYGLNLSFGLNELNEKPELTNEEDSDDNTN